MAMKQKKWTQAQKIEQLEKVTTNLYILWNNLSKEVQELKNENSK